jgi:hypothetical protein
MKLAEKVGNELTLLAVRGYGTLIFPPSTEFSQNTLPVTQNTQNTKTKQ